MSRSYRHTPITGLTTAESDKAYKKIERGKARTAECSALARGDDPLAVTTFGDP